MSQHKKDELIVSGGVRPRGEFFRNNIRPNGGRRETFKGVSTGFSCGLGNEECELFKTRGGRPAPVRRREGFVPGGLHPGSNMGGAFVGNLGPRQFSGNASADLSAAGKVDIRAAERARQARDVTSKSDQRLVGEARARFGAAVASKREAGREGFRGKTMSAADLEKEGFKSRRGIAQAAKKVEGFAPKRSQMSEQYMRKVTPGSKPKGFRAQYGM
jgi:hypothetical protein